MAACFLKLIRRKCITDNVILEQVDNFVYLSF
jgi:hypothetical protein